jgi:hypothetical protein
VEDKYNSAHSKTARPRDGRFNARYSWMKKEFLSETRRRVNISL